MKTFQKYLELITMDFVFNLVSRIEFKGNENMSDEIFHGYRHTRQMGKIRKDELANFFRFFFTILDPIKHIFEYIFLMTDHGFRKI